jgi:hypothetical protein
VGRFEIDLPRPGKEQMVSFCKHCNELSASLKNEKFND